MGRRLADNEIMVAGDRLIIDGKFYQLVDGFGGRLAGYWPRYAKARERITAECWVEMSDRREIESVCDRLEAGLGKIIEELWKSD